MAYLFFAREALSAVFWTPIWWYGEGAVLFLRASWQFLKNYTASLAVLVWVRNLFVPMFGLYDWQSRIISVLMRGFQISIRSMWLCIVYFLALLVICAYFLLPIVLFAGVILAII